MTTNDFVVFSGALRTSYSQMYVLSGVRTGEILPDNAFTGQVNGILGGSFPGGLFMYIGVHTGLVHITVYSHPSEPPVDESWEEIVEASCSLSGPPVSLDGWGDMSSVRLPPLPAGQYRARLCANGFKQSESTRVFGDPSIEKYALLLWPDPWRKDVILKQSSEITGFRHGEVVKFAQ